MLPWICLNQSLCVGREAKKQLDWNYVQLQLITDVFVVVSCDWCVQALGPQAAKTLIGVQYTKNVEVVQANDVSASDEIIIVWCE